jgi:hypothetical protein
VGRNSARGPAHGVKLACCGLVGTGSRPSSPWAGDLAKPHRSSLGPTHKRYRLPVGPKRGQGPATHGANGPRLLPHVHPWQQRPRGQRWLDRSRRVGIEAPSGDHGEEAMETGDPFCLPVGQRNVLQRLAMVGHRQRREAMALELVGW